MIIIILYQYGLKLKRHPKLNYWSLFLIALLFISNPPLAYSQTQQTGPNDKAVKVAYVNHSLLRKESMALRAVQEKTRTAWQAAERGHQQQMVNQAESGRKALEHSQLQRRRQLQEEGIAAIKAQEERIIEAIGEVASEGGFTDVRPLASGALPLNGQDITQLVLRKLN